MLLSNGYKPSPQQKRIWALRHSGSLRGEAVLRCTFSGQIEPKAIASRLALLVEEHEVLRTRLRCLDGYVEPLQFIGADGDWTFCELERPETEAGSNRLDRDADGHTPLSVHVRVQAEGATSLEIRAGSEMLDARSLLWLAEQLLGLSSPEQGDDALQYADVSAWLRDMLTDTEADEARRYWESAQRSATASFRQISPDRWNTNTRGGAIARRAIRISEDLARKAGNAAGHASVSLEAVFLTAWLELLRRLGGGEGQSCSVAFDGISGNELASVLGPLTRFLPTCAPPAHASIAEGLRSVQRVLDSGRAFQECYFVEDEVNRLPYGFEFNAGPENRPPGWRIQALWSDVEDWRILLSIYSDSEGMQAVFACPDTVPESAIDAISEQWLALLSIITDMDFPIQDVPLSSPVLSDWARRYGEGPRREREGTLLDWLDEVQVTYGTQQLEGATERISLTELNQCSNALAKELVARGLRPGEFAGIHIGRSTDFILAALATVKAGAAYVPLDVTAPSGRIADLLSQFPFSAIITGAESDVPAQVKEHPGLVQLARGERPKSNDAPEVRLNPEDPIYVLFTSGSTGVPKPVVIPHRALLNHMAWMIETFSFGATDRFLVRTSTTFDASVWEMWAPLLVGASAIITAHEADHDVEGLLHHLQEGRISVAQFVPSLLAVLVSTGQVKNCHHLRMLFCGGEALGAALLRSVGDTTSAELVNLYGPTECCIDAAFWRTATAMDRGRVAIGSPIANTSLYVLDQKQRPAGVGIAGELCIGGAGLFSGYFGQPERTADALVPNPFGPGFLYRTGDQARLADDGLFEFVGRLDDQIQLNGYRIELGEIDSALERVAGTERVATVVTADRQLVSFVADKDRKLDTIALRHSLSELLAGYMVPSRIEHVESLPLRRNGKVDRTALQKLASDRRRLDAHVPPEGDLETSLVAIWSKVLGTDTVGVTDSFFALGGDSIRSIQIVYEAKSQGLELSVREILHLRTIRAIARAVTQRPAAGREPAAEALPNVSRMDLLPDEARVTDCYPASHMQAYVIDAYARDRARRGIFHAQQGFTATGTTFQPTAFADALRSVANAPNFRTRFLSGEGGLFQVVLPDGAVEISLERVAEPLDSRFASIVAEDRRRAFDPFDFDQALLRAYVVSHPNDQEHRILISNHHAIQDGWGNVEFLNRLAGQLTGQEAVSSNSAANGCKELVAIEALEPRLGSGQMRDLIGSAAHSDRPIGNSLSKSQTFSFSRNLGTLLVARAEQHGIALKSLILAVYYSCLAKSLALRAPVVGVVANGRDSRLSDPLRAMGLFWYFAPFRMALAEDFAPQNLPRIEEHLLKAEMSARACWGEPGVNRDVMTRFTFNFVNFHNSSADLSATGWRMDHRLDDFGADIALAVGFAPEAEDMLTLILDYSPVAIDEEQIGALQRGFRLRLEEFAQGSTPPCEDQL
jgi:amino acid adenylation domain-containing protein